MIRCKTMSIAVALLVACSLIAPAGASEGMKTLGTDAGQDAPIGSDLTALQVGMKDDALLVRIEIDLVPGVGGNPEAGIQWSFRSGSRPYAVEAHQVSAGNYGFTLFDTRGGIFTQVASVEGSTDTIGGAFEIEIPLNLIKAKKGTRIRGAQLEDGVGDVEVHQHSAVASEILDDLTTTKTFKIR